MAALAGLKREFCLIFSIAFESTLEIGKRSSSSSWFYCEEARTFQGLFQLLVHTFKASATVEKQP